MCRHELLDVIFQSQFGVEPRPVVGGVNEDEEDLEMFQSRLTQCALECGEAPRCFIALKKDKVGGFYGQRGPAAARFVIVSCLRRETRPASRPRPNRPC